MYDRGSLFHIKCSSEPDVERLLALQQQGLGIRKAEGFGQILFLRRELLEGLKHKRAAQTAGQLTPQQQNIQNLRRAKYDWIMTKARNYTRMNFLPASLEPFRHFVKRRWQTAAVWRN